LHANPCVVPSAPLKLALLDPKRLRKLRIIASHLLDEALRVLAAAENVE
jgi:hypothetical protein